MNSSHTFTALLAAGLLPALASGQTCSVVTDLDTIGSGYSSNPEGEILNLTDNEEYSFVQLGSHWYFSADTLLGGEELYRTDGTAAGTTLVKDINPGAGDSFISRMTVYGGKLWFSASDGTHGNELWTSDGTAAGTHLVKDIRVGSGSASINNITGFGGKVYFAANDSVTGTELYVSDGTAAGTMQVLDINPGSSSSSAGRLTVDPTGTKLLFRASDGVNGTELWESDGTAAGTQMLADISPGSGSSFPDYMVHFNGEVYMKAQDGANGYELWKTDGTGAGTVMVADIKPGPSGSNANLNYHAIYNGELYFRADGPTGYEPWKTDGTTAGTVQVHDVDVAGSSNPQDFVVHNGLLYFSADDNAANGRELWVTDGTWPGTTLVYDFAPGSTDGLDFSNNNLTSFNGDLYLTAGVTTSDEELWKTDGTLAGTVLVKDITGDSDGSSPDWFTPISATQLMFTADTEALGEELYVTDGTTAGTNLLVEVDGNVITGDGNPDDLHSVGGDYVLFLADDGLIGEELYRWDKASGVTLLKDINPGSSGSSASTFFTTWLNGQLVTLFRANDGSFGTELWITDGTAAGTNMLLDINGGGSASPSGFFYHPVHKVVYFAANDGTNGTEMWRTDGTVLGTWMVADINPLGSSSPGGFIDYGAEIIFRANDGTSGSELFKSNGTAPGTSLILDIQPGVDTTFGNPLAGFPQDFWHADGKILFSANDGVVGRELWTTDGTTAGTSLLIDLYPGAVGQAFDDMVRWKGEIWFEGENDTVGQELWKTDGTAAGTVMVADTRPGPDNGSPSYMMVSGGKLFFSAYDPSTNGRELWSSDGTAAGTAMVADVNPGTSSSTPLELTAVDNGVYFKANDGTNGSELWFSDGTAAGTAMVCDIFPGSNSSSPVHLVRCAGDLLFTADDPYVGKELHAITAVGAYSQDLGLPGIGAPNLTSTAPMLGSSITFEGENAPVGSIGLLLMSGHVGTPTTLFTDFFSVNWLDVATFSIQGVTTTPSWSITKPIPALPSLAGVQLNMQAWYLPAGTLPAGTSNGLHLVVQ